MRKLKICLFIVLSALTISPAFAQLSPDKKGQRIKASYSIVSGRAPSAGELDFWMKQPDLSLRDLVARHTAYAATEPSFKRDLIIKSYRHALGRQPSEGEIAYWAPGADTYNNLMRNHISWLQGNPGEYEKVIKASYVTAMGRDPNADELAWWKKQNVYSYAVLVHCHKDYISRNRTGAFNMVSNLVSGVMNAYPISSDIAQEVQSVMGLVGGTPVLAQGAAGLQTMLGAILPNFSL